VSCCHTITLSLGNTVMQSILVLCLRPVSEADAEGLWTIIFPPHPTPHSTTVCWILNFLTTFLTTFCQLFDNFLITYRQLFVKFLISFWQLFDNFFDNLLTTFCNFFTTFWTLFDYFLTIFWQIFWTIFGQFLSLELLFPHYNTFVTPQVFQMTAKGTVGAPTCFYTRDTCQRFHFIAFETKTYLVIISNQ
jgi:hypothetical protein